MYREYVQQNQRPKMQKVIKLKKKTLLLTSLWLTDHWNEDFYIFHQRLYN